MKTTEPMAPGAPSLARPRFGATAFDALSRPRFGATAFDALARPRFGATVFDVLSPLWRGGGGRMLDPGG